jgi:hypothetical protein
MCLNKNFGNPDSGRRSEGEIRLSRGQASGKVRVKRYHRWALGPLSVSSASGLSTSGLSTSGMTR